MIRRRTPDPERAVRDEARSTFRAGLDRLRGVTPAPAAPTPRPAKPRRRARRGDLELDAWLDEVRSLPCALCERPAPSSAHHYPTKAHGRCDLFAMPACGDGVRGCHGDCHADRVPAERQAALVGQTLGRLILARLDKLDRRDQAEQIRAALVAALTSVSRCSPILPDAI